ncbi:hypothetical protein D3C73_1267450 [compost metagenome]
MHRFESQSRFRDQCAELLQGIQLHTLVVLARRSVRLGRQYNILFHITVLNPPLLVDQIISVFPRGVGNEMSRYIRGIQKIDDEPAAWLQHPPNFAQHLHMLLVLLEVSE